MAVLVASGVIVSVVVTRTMVTLVIRSGDKDVVKCQSSGVGVL
jgi:hypothetical protein